MPTWFSALNEAKGLNRVFAVTKIILLAWVPAQIIHLLVLKIHPGPASDLDLFKTPVQALAIAILLAPIIESYLMKWLFHWLGKLIPSEAKMNLASAILWGALHVASESWGLPAIWAFFVMGLCYLKLRTRSEKTALYTLMIVHASVNALSYALYAIETQFS